MDMLESIMASDGGFNEYTIMKLIGRMLGELNIPVSKIEGDSMRFRPIGASTFGGYIYKSGVIMIFNEHTSPFSKSKLCMKEAIMEMCRKTSGQARCLCKEIERQRTLYLIKLRKSYEDVYGSNGDQNNLILDKMPINVADIPEEEMTCYMDTRLPFKNSLLSKVISGETTIWDVLTLIRGKSKGGERLKALTKKARGIKEGKLMLPVIYPNFHIMEIERSFKRWPNRVVTLDFDLNKQGISLKKSFDIRSAVEGFDETICTCESFTMGNFWALVAIDEPRTNYESVAIKVIKEVQSRLNIFRVEVDKSAGRMTQARVVVTDETAMIKHPTSRFTEN